MVVIYFILFLMGGGGGGEGGLFSPASVAFAKTIPIFVSLTMAPEHFQSFQKTVQTPGPSLSTPLLQLTDGVNVFGFVSQGPQHSRFRSSCLGKCSDRSL